MIIIQFRRVLIHNLLCICNSVLAFGLRHLLLIGLHIVLLDLVLGVLVEKIDNLTITCRCRVDGQSSGEVPMSTELDVVQEIDGKVLTVVADQVVGGAFASHGVYGDLT